MISADCGMLGLRAHINENNEFMGVYEHEVIHKGWSHFNVHVNHFGVAFLVESLMNCTVVTFEFVAFPSTLNTFRRMFLAFDSRDGGSCSLHLTHFVNSPNVTRGALKMGVILQRALITSPCWSNRSMDTLRLFVKAELCIKSHYNALNINSYTMFMWLKSIIWN